MVVIKVISPNLTTVSLVTKFELVTAAAGEIVPTKSGVHLIDKEC